MAADTTALSYWLNSRFFLCAAWLLSAMVASAFTIWKFEGPKKSKTELIERSRETVGLLYKSEAWKTSLNVVHPGWLLAYRVAAFAVLLSLLITNIALEGGGIFFFYTQWTFTLVAIYFGFASLFSIYGYCKGWKEDGVRVTSDAEWGAYVAPTFEEDCYRDNASKTLNSEGEFLVAKIANTWGYIFQIIYQICAGSVVLTDCVFWFIIYPFMTSDDYVLGFIDICFHSINAVLLIGDVFLNCLRFPFFRMAYFILWTCIYVTFQWIIHFCVSFWWPYPFLDLSSPYAPIWYLAVGLLHLPCYAAFVLIMRLKHSCLLKLFPDAYQCSR